jgi:hypothetical protein
MKKTLQFLLSMFLSISFLQAQEITVNMSMGSDYTNQLFYKLSTETETSFAANLWDIAMLRTSSMAFSLRVNEGIGITVFEVSNTPSDWATIDVKNEASWTQLYNSDISWGKGAFDQGSATYGWGEYNSQTHHVEGTIIFVLKYSDGTYRKFINEDFYGGYTFKYSTWDGSSWSADQTVTIPNSNNPNNTFNYYSLQNDEEVVAEPETINWDLKFTKYYTEVAPNMKYLVTGVLHSNAIEIAENDEPDGMSAAPSLNYSAEINTIGYDWKSFTGGSYLVDSDKAFYVKYSDGSIYRLYFTAFSGGNSGDLSFNFENVTEALGVEKVREGVTFGVYPNPVKRDKKINIIFDVQTVSLNDNSIEIYNLVGQRVLRTKITNTKGFHEKEIDLSSLNSGIYLLRFNSGKYQKLKKIIIQ